MTDLSIGQQIEEVEYELAQRERVYPRIVAKEPRRRSEMAYHVARMEAVKRSLEWLRDNRPAIVEAMKQKRDL